MDNIFQVLNYVKATLQGKILDEKILDSREFYKISRENGLIGLVYSSLDKKNIDEEVFKRMEQDFFIYMKKDLSQRNVISNLESVLTNNNLKYVLLKGAHLKKLYPESYLRGMGDIDVFVLKNEFDIVCKKLEEENYILNARSLVHTTFIKDGEDVEVHPGLTYAGDSKFLKLINNAEYFLVDGIKFKREFELLYLIFHLEKHFKSGGIGLRSVLDIGVFIKSYQNEIENDLLNELVNKYDVRKFAQTIIYLNNYLFDLDINLTILNDYVVNSEMINSLTKYIATTGIHGVGSNYNEFSARVMSAGNSRFKFLMSRLFPSVREMKGFFPVLNKVVILLPFFYVVRFLQVVIFRGRRNYQKLKKTKKVNLDQEIVKLFQDIDIL